LPPGGPCRGMSRYLFFCQSNFSIAYYFEKYCLPAGPAGAFNLFIMYTRAMVKLFSERTMVIVKKYSRLFLRNTTLFFNPNPSLSQETALRCFIPCILDTSLPDPNSNLFKIGLYFVFIKTIGKNYGILILSPQP
jgi:hypothetical protein